MLENCPHCFASVLPLADGTCPRCQEDTKDKSGVDPALQPVTITKATKFPDACVICGSNATGRRRVTQSVGSDVNALGGVLLTAVFGIFGRILGQAIAGEERQFTESMRVPVCDECKPTRNVRVLSTDYEKHQMTILVHERCRRQMSSR